MAFDAMMLGIYKVPEITVNSGTDWVTLFGFLLTALAVIAGSLVTVWTFKKTVHSQEELARKVSLKESRQNWINELRDSCSEFVACVMSLQSQVINVDSRRRQLDNLQLEDRVAAAQLTHEINVGLKEIRLRAFALKTKIALLSNPKEADFQSLAVIVEECMAKAEVLHSEILDPCNRLTILAQAILKAEWDRAKTMS